MQWIHYWYPNVSKSTGKVEDNPGLKRQGLDEALEEGVNQLSRVELEKQNPVPFGGVLLKDANRFVEYSDIAINSPPDVDQNTRILAICGIGPDEAAPSQEDGWFVSDMMALYALFGGATKFQTWSVTSHIYWAADLLTLSGYMASTWISSFESTSNIFTEVLLAREKLSSIGRSTMQL